MVAVGTTVSTGGPGGGSVTATVGTGGVSVGTSVTVGTGGVSVTSATSTGTGVMGACGDGPDAMILEENGQYTIVMHCTMDTVGNTGNLPKCLHSKWPLSHACIGCFADYGECSLEACGSVCEPDLTTASCEACRNQNCGAAFAGCSGFPALGSVTCDQILTDGGAQQTVNGQVPAEAFVTGYANSNYFELKNCGCSTKAPGHCRNVCDDALSNGPPDFCNGAPASADCLSCLENHCSTELMSCQGT